MTVDQKTNQQQHIYPHEDIASIPTLSGTEWVEAAKIFGQTIPNAFRVRNGTFGEGQAFAFQFINGDVGVELASKQSFGYTVRQLGYLAPSSILIQAGTDAHEIVEAIDLELPDEPSFFVKPVFGVGGRDTRLFTDRAALAELLSTSEEDFLVQSDETPEQDWRYVAHKDSEDPNKVWRVAYKKVRPIVIGNGYSTLGDLILESTSIPADRKAKIIKSIGSKASSIGLSNQEIVVAESGNISNGAYGKLPDETELTRMDAFMSRFINDLEEHIGTRLNTLCFDVGVKDSTVFDGDYDFDKMRKSIVFYEFQIPFGVSGYLDEIYGADGRPTENIRGRLQKIRLMYRVSQSALKNMIDKNN